MLGDPENGFPETDVTYLIIIGIQEINQHLGIRGSIADIIPAKSKT